MFPTIRLYSGRQASDAVVRGYADVFDERDCRKTMQMGFRGELQCPSHARIVNAQRIQRSKRRGMFQVTVLSVRDTNQRQSLYPQPKRRGFTAQVRQVLASRSQRPGSWNKITGGGAQAAVVAVAKKLLLHLRVQCTRVRGRVITFAMLTPRRAGFVASTLNDDCERF
jgi:hypothetical protein